jgi:hypothetical protein
LLAFQLVLVIAMNLSGDDYGAYQSDEKLLPFDIETINRLRFDDGTQHVILEKQDDGWVLPEMWNYPVNADALGKLLKETFARLLRGTIIALKIRKKCSFTSCKLRFFANFCLILAPLMTPCKGLISFNFLRNNYN